VARLSPETVFHRVETTSTFDEGWSLIDEGQSPDFWVTADRQTRGRGRRGNSWVSQTGNLHASYFCRLDYQPHIIEMLPLVIGVAVLEAIEKTVNLPTLEILSLKWPNDIMLNGKKLSGILIERRHAKNNTIFGIGIGINCSFAPDIIDQKVTSLASEGYPANKDDIFENLRNSLRYFLDSIENRQTSEQVIATWLSRCQSIGKSIEVRLPRETLKGIFKGMNDRGHLLLQGQQGQITPIIAGTVFDLE
jgi:BirA family biotin operon repressor/biotin-[acetyl-CoA-carboxylase] ligase